MRTGAELRAFQGSLLLGAIHEVLAIAYGDKTPEIHAVVVVCELETDAGHAGMSFGVDRLGQSLETVRQAGLLSIALATHGSQLTSHEDEEEEEEEGE
jgi:hypothetical protein